MTAVRKKPRARKCKVCSTKFQPRNSFQVVCMTVACAVQYSIRQRQKRERAIAKLERQWKREGRERLKTRREWMADAQKAFNAYIRERDAPRTCISCPVSVFTLDVGLTGGGWDCGHYLSVGAHPELRFEELNAHKQCKKCNNYRSGNAGNYRLGLVHRIGIAKVEWLEGPHEPAKYTVDDLKAICFRYRAKLKDLKSKPGAFAKLSAGSYA
jgi:hypothetical protein